MLLHSIPSPMVQLAEGLIQLLRELWCKRHILHSALTTGTTMTLALYSSSYYSSSYYSSSYYSSSYYSSSYCYFHSSIVSADLFHLLLLSILLFYYSIILSISHSIMSQ